MVGLSFSRLARVYLSLAFSATAMCTLSKPLTHPHSSVPGLSLVNANRVSVWIINKCHPADRRFHRFHVKLHPFIPQVSNRAFEIVHLQPNGTTRCRRLPVRRSGANRQRAIR